MMAIRWKVIEFDREIPERQQKKISPCARWFAELTLLGEEDIGRLLSHTIIQFRSAPRGTK